MHGKWRRGPQPRERHPLLRRTPGINLSRHLSDRLTVIGTGDRPGTERHRSVTPDSPAVGIQAEWLLSLAQMRDNAWKVIYRTYRWIYKAVSDKELLENSLREFHAQSVPSDEKGCLPTDIIRGVYIFRLV